LTDISQLRNNFPALQTLDSKQQIYLDSAATTQTPQSVIDALNNFYASPHANVHRSGHLLGTQTTNQFEAVRKQTAEFIKAPNDSAIVWTKGTTEAINLIVHSWAESNLKKGDGILLSELEHHANLLPWQKLADQKGIVIHWLPIDELGLIDLQQAELLLTPEIKCISLSHASNVTGVINPVQKLFQKARKLGITTLLDGSQTVAHIPIDVSTLNCDFFMFSSHKMYGPKGIGVLYVNPQYFSKMQPWLLGGEMVKKVGYGHAEFQPMPLLLEAGTPNFAGVIGFGAALKYLNSIDRKALMEYESALHDFLMQQLLQFKDIRILGNNRDNSWSDKVPLISFSFSKHQSFDVSALLNEQNIFIRSGYHCAMPMMKKLALSGTIRVSLGLYNNKKDITIMINKLKNTLSLLS